jgi:hypothetical protein
MTDTTRIGDHSEAQIIARLVQLYDVVLIPFGGGKRYDVVAETDGIFTRFQCKTGRLRNGAIWFNVKMGHAYTDEIDKFAVYCPQTDKVYAVDEAETRKNKEGFGFRVSPAKSNQRKGIRWARDYEI